MDLGAVETIFSFGKLLGLTPSTTKNLTVSTPRKIYIISIFLFCSVCSTILLVQQVSRYSNLTLIHSALEILLQVVLFAHSFYILIVSGLLKQRQWSQLLRNLQRVECEPSNKKSLHLIFFLPNAAYAVTIVFVFYAWIKIVGGAKLFKMHTLESLQAYSPILLQRLGLRCSPNDPVAVQESVLLVEPTLRPNAETTLQSASSQSQAQPLGAERNRGSLQRHFRVDHPPQHLLRRFERVDLPRQGHQRE
jgi:hypothetical protein